MLRELTNKNLTYLHMWGENLQNTYSEDEIRDHIKKAQEDAGFLDFFFLSADGNYKMVTGETGYLGLQENIEEDIRQGNDVIANAAVPGRPQMFLPHLRLTELIRDLNMMQLPLLMKTLIS